MNSYDAYVTGMTIRRITVQAENQKAAEAEAMREFMALVGGTEDVEIVDIEIINDDDDLPLNIVWERPYNVPVDTSINDEIFQANAEIQKHVSKILTDEA
jgi:hypothetical protein|tara:strand:+ start:596 stop:895 length:300 start_codon:yes stop_codon:yes gene_type:complete